MGFIMGPIAGVLDSTDPLGKFLGEDMAQAQKLGIHSIDVHFNNGTPSVEKTIDTTPVSPSN